jgi:hypothetical protein
MKKILIFAIIFISIIAILPIIGNEVTQKELQNRLDLLVSHGVEVKDSSTESSYLTTSKYYKLQVVDSDKFITYIQQFSDSQLPPYVNSLINGVTIGTDITYSNSPFSEAISVNIYPLTFSTDFMNDIASKNVKFSKFLNDILQSKGILYHINYSVIKENFNGFIKDFDKSYVLDDGRKMRLSLKGSTFNGNGSLISPDNIDSKVKEILFTISEPNENIEISLNNWSITSNFESVSTYLHSVGLDKFNFKINNKHQDIHVAMKKFKFNVSSNTQGKKAELFAKTSFNDLDINQNIRLQNLNYDIALKDIDKDSFEKIRVLLIKTKSSNSLNTEKELESSVMNMIANGLNIVLADFSVKTIDYKEHKNINGFSLKTNLLLKKDLDIAKKIKINPKAIINNIELNTTFKLSKQMFEAITKEIPMAGTAKGRAKEDGNNLVFEFSLKDGNPLINGKSLK